MCVHVCMIRFRDLGCEYEPYFKQSILVPERIVFKMIEADHAAKMQYNYYSVGARQILN